MCFQRITDVIDSSAYTLYTARFQLDYFNELVSRQIGRIMSGNLRYGVSVLLPLCMYVRLSVCFYLLHLTEYVCYLMFTESMYSVFCILCAAFWRNKR